MDNELFLNKDGETYQEIMLLILELQKTLLLMGDNQKFYDNADLKCLLNVSDRTLYRMRKMNKIPFFKVGNKYYYPYSSLTKKLLPKSFFCGVLRVFYFVYIGVLFNFIKNNVSSNFIKYISNE